MLSSDVLNLQGALFASWDFDSGLWLDVSDVVIAEDSQIAEGNEIVGNVLGHERDVPSGCVAEFDETVGRLICVLIPSRGPLF